LKIEASRPFRFRELRVKMWALGRQFPVCALISHLAQTLGARACRGQKQRPSDAILIAGLISSIS